MKLSQMYRTALIATMMLILSSGLDMRGFAQANSPQGDQKYCPGSRRLGGWIVLVQSDCAPPSEGFSCGRCAESFDLAG
jgi:hypothetical protein